MNMKFPTITLVTLMATKCFRSFCKPGEKLSLGRQLNKNAETR